MYSIFLDKHGLTATYSSYNNTMSFTCQTSKYKNYRMFLFTPVALKSGREGEGQGERVKRRKVR